MRRSIAALSVWVMLVLISCGASPEQAEGKAQASASHSGSAPGLPAAADRAVVVTTTGCGFAPNALGSGIAISPTRVLTVAHVIAGSQDITVSPAPSGTENNERFAERKGQAVAYDPLRDLALIEITAGQPFAVDQLTEPAVLSEGDNGLIVGAATSGDVPFTVSNKTGIETSEVRGTRRSRRSGYMIDARTDSGDSGSGLYDGNGHLAGLLFAVSTVDGQRSWATAGDEIQAFFDDPSVTGVFECNPDQSQLEASG